VSVAVCPLHIVALAPAFAAGKEFTATLTELAAVQLEAFVTVTVYVIGEAGDATGF
jgi:hypothetical protein